MFLDYYQLRHQPFGEVCGPGQIYPSHEHAEATDSFRHLLLAERGNLVLIAESGLGKSTLLHHLFEKLRQTGRPAGLFRKECDANAILHFLLQEVGIDSTAMDATTMLRKLKEVWFAELLAGKRFVLLFDDAEFLPVETLETLSHLSKFETSKSRLLQLVLCGGPLLLEKLENDSFAQLRKRVVDFKRLASFSPMETAGYIRQRLHAAGYRGESLFDPEALAVVAERSQGIPRNINRICSRALFESYARGLRSIPADIVEKAENNLALMNAAGSAATPSQVVPASAPTVLVRPRTLYPSPARIPLRFRLPGSGIWAGAAVALLLSAGLALPHGMLRGMSQVLRGEDSSIFSAVQTNPVVQTNASAPLVSNPAPTGLEPLTSSARPAKDTVSPDASTHTVSAASAEPLDSQPAPLSLTRELGLKINRIVIDPGHGGFDTGAKGPHGLLEKDLCLDVALRLGQMIEEKIPGAEVVYTRKDDSYVPLEERTAIANGAGADLFISIHANSSDAREVRGVETYYLSLATTKEAKELAIRENALTQSSLHDLPELVRRITNNDKIAESKLLASEIQGMLSQRLQLVSRREKNRGVKQAPFIVLTGANMPAVLSEISFVSNASDETLLLQGAQRERVAEGLYRGIAAYLDGLNGVPESRQKLLTENRANGANSFERAFNDNGRGRL